MGLFGTKQTPAPVATQTKRVKNNRATNPQTDASLYVLETAAYFFELFSPICEPSITVKPDSNKEGGYLVSLNGVLTVTFNSPTEMMNHIQVSIFGSSSGQIVIKDCKLGDDGFHINFSVRF